MEARAGEKHSTETVPQAQVAMVVIDPKTGEIKALAGGRNYGQSQLNRAEAKRQPGSAFKPFVYAAAFDDAAETTGPILTTITTVVDEPTTFQFDGKDYTPDNFGEEFMGTVTLRDALTHSLNVATGESCRAGRTWPRGGNRTPHGTRSRNSTDAGAGAGRL